MLQGMVSPIGSDVENFFWVNFCGCTFRKGVKVEGIQ
jgi:hypothetical protein